jgi:hypothetical protein
MMSKIFLIALALIASVSALVPPAAIEVNVANIQHSASAFQNPSAVQDGLQKYLNAPQGLESSTLALSLKDRPPPPCVYMSSLSIFSSPALPNH